MPTQQKTSQRRGRRTRKPSISPERRSLILALWGIALVVLLSIPLGKLPGISLIPACLKGLFGLGYYFVPLSLLVGGYMLLAHSGTLGVLQLLTACIIPIPIGSIHHAICYVAEASESPAPSLWETGAALESGGVISGGLAQVLVSILGNTISAVLFAITLAALLGIDFLPSLLIQSTPNKKQPERRYYREPDESFDAYYPEVNSYTSAHTSPKRTAPKRTRSAAKPNISEYNMPMDGDKAAKNDELLSDAEEMAPRGFYIPKSSSTFSPADLMLKILGESLQTPSDPPPAAAPVEQPKQKQTSAPSKPVRTATRPATWTPFVWTPTTRSEPAWAIPANTDNKSKKRSPDKSPVHKPEEIQEEDQAPVTESPQDIVQPDIIEHTAEESSESNSDPAAEEPLEEEPEENQTITVFPLIEYFDPHKAPKIFPKSSKIILFPQPKPSVPPALPPTNHPLLLSDHSIVNPIKRLPAPAPVLLLPPHQLPPMPPWISAKLISSISTSIPVFGEIKIFRGLFSLVDYTYPQKRVYNLHKSETESDESCSIKRLPAPVLLLLLPPAQPPQIPNGLRFIVPKDIYELREVRILDGAEHNVTEELSFVLIDYIYPQKETYDLRSKHSVDSPIKRLPAPSQPLLLLSALSYPQLPTPPHRLLLSAYKDVRTCKEAEIIEAVKALGDRIFVETVDGISEETSFVLIDYTLPPKRAYNHLRSSKTDSSTVCQNKALPSPASVPILPSAPSYLLLPRSPGRLLLPAPENTTVSEGPAMIEDGTPVEIINGATEETAFELVGYTPPQKRVCEFRSELHAPNPIKALPASVQILFLPTGPSHLLLPQFPDRLLLPAPADTLLSTESIGYNALKIPEKYAFRSIESYMWDTTPFTLVNYCPPQRRISNLNNSRSRHSGLDSIRQLPTSAPTLFLPSGPSYPLFSKVPDRLLLPAPEVISLSDRTKTIESSVFVEIINDVSEETSFELIGYVPPRKRIYRSRTAYTSAPIKSLPSSAQTLLLPPGPSYTLLPPIPGRLLLPAPAPLFLLPPASLPCEPPEQTPEIPGESYTLPPLELFHYRPNSEQVDDTADLNANAEHLCDVLKSFGVKVSCGDVVRGPAITQYEFTLERGVKLAKITNLADDIALSLGASGVRIAPIPGKISVVGIEVPNKHIAPVYIRDVLASPEFREHKSPVAFAIGKDIGNRSVVGDIAALPHILIAGTTGSGKSVCTNSLISSILCKASPDDARFIMIDPKMVELAPYNGIPHLLVPVVTDPKKAAGALQWAVFEMMKRYKQFSELGVKKLAEYNALAESDPDIEHMPTVVIVIDELADLMLVAAKEVEESICRVAQMGRAAGMHLVIATQRPSSDVITGLMKANIPSRIAFAVASSLESRIILDGSGAEKLVGRGDMLYSPLGVAKPQRVQGCYITPEEIERVINYVKSNGEAHYSDEIMEKIEESVKEKDSKGDSSNAEPVNTPDSEEEVLLRSAVEIFLDCGQASVSMLQRRLKLGYSRAARLVDEMEERGYVGPFEGSKPRKILISKAEWAEICLNSGVESDNF